MSNQQGHQQRRPRPTNAPSLLLSDSDNETLFNLMGRNCVTLASSVVQLYMAIHPQRTRWNKRCSGVVCFIKDNGQRSYFFRLFDIRKREMLWEQELYNQIKYKTPRDYFHTFEADDAQTGLNFADEDEASRFKNAVEKKLAERHDRKMGKHEYDGQAPNCQHQVSAIDQTPLPVMETNIRTKPKADTDTLKVKKNDKKDKGKKKLTKDDISTPTNFRHVGHVGWDPNKGLDMDNLDPDMKCLFETVGIQEGADKETVDFIYDFVEKHGGIDAVKKEISTVPPPPPRSREPPVPHPSQPPPAVRPQQPQVPRPAPNRGQLPPPPPNRLGPAPAVPSNPPFMTSKASAPQLPPPLPPGGKSSVPIPPPAPAAPAAPPAPAIPAAPAMSNMPPPPMAAPSDGRGALLSEIRKGSELKHVTEQSGGGGVDARSDLLGQIRGGATLKRVEQTESKTLTKEETVGIVGALARALATRQKQIQGSDDETEDSDEDDVSDDEEWDD
ncbi:hypothetical protein ScPMuIL_009127 [Solemya velum]